MKKKIAIFFVFITIIFICEIGFGYSMIDSKKDIPIDNYTNIPPEKYFEINQFEVKTNSIYLAPSATKQIKYDLEINSNYEEPLLFTSEDETIASVDENGLVTANNNGTTTIYLQIKEEVKEVKVVVTSLINKVSEKWDKQKKLLTCNKYTEEENDLLDEILSSRVEEAGLKTRAGVLAAARFITLEFPYKIGYFSENGRLDHNRYTNYVDGEGRYYHKGLYLHKSRFSNIVKKMYGPNTWGCSIYSYVSEGSRRNGFDCSGYIAWILLNGGFDPGDIGSGISNVLTDMTDLGKKKKLTESLNNKELKSGDLLSGPYTTGGHIAMIMGIKGEEYYVTECLWGNGDYGVIVRTYTKETLKNYFKWHIDMDSYYIEEGNYTENWI